MAITLPNSAGIVKCKNCGEGPVWQNGLCFGCFNDPHMEA